MATHPRLVNKQFNSPIGLYSSQNVQEILVKNSQILENGAVGIDFHNSNVGKPANLQNSAVLRMLEEEENRRKNGYGPGAAGTTPKRVAWPPPNESGPDSPYVEQNAVSGQGGPQYPSQSPGLPQRQPSQSALAQRAPLRPLDVSQKASSPLPSPVLNQSPQGFRSAVSARPWAPVNRPSGQATPAPVRQQPPQSYPTDSCAGPEPYYPPSQGYAPAPRPQVCPSPAPYSPQPQVQGQQSPKVQVCPVSYPANTPRAAAFQGISHPAVAPVQCPPQVQSARPFEPPPSTITLRPQAPVSQAPPQVYASQPATATIKGGKHLRGDLKWPPENVKMQAEEENRLRIALAKGPVCRPRRPNKDYTSFFEQNALNSTYPGYKIPPGTQFFRQF